MQLLEYSRTINARRLDVEEHEVRCPTLHALEPFPSRLGADDLTAFVLQDQPPPVAKGRVVVDNQDASQRLDTSTHKTRDGKSAGRGAHNAGLTSLSMIHQIV
jgi:hypothetical protein